MKNKRIVFMGTPSIASYVLEGLINNGLNIVGVVTQPDKEVGRKKVLTPSPCKEVALKYNLPIFQPKKIREEYTDILALEPDMILTLAYGQIIPKEILDYPKYRCVNAHGSLLPKYRGGAPIQRSIINGDEVTGMTIMFMDEKMDEGDILYKEEIKIEDNDTNTALFDKMAHLTLDMLLKFLPDYFNGNYTAIKQDNSLATYAYNIKKEEEFISFNNSTKVVYNHIRGLLDNPGAYFVLENKKYKLISVGYEATCNEDNSLIDSFKDNYMRINCNDGFIKVYKLKPEGKNEMDAKAFYNGQGRSLIGKRVDTVYHG